MIQELLQAKSLYRRSKSIFLNCKIGAREGFTRTPTLALFNRRLNARSAMPKLVSGFTLIELLIVVAIIAILAALVFAALDPLTRFQDARDSTRWRDVNELVSAIKLDQVDNGGEYFTILKNVSIGNYMITDNNAIAGCNITCDISIVDSDCLDLGDLVTEEYIGEIPISPPGVTTWSVSHTGYYLIKRAAGSITIGACESENTSNISVTR